MLENMHSAVTGHSILDGCIRYVNHVQTICTDFSPILAILKGGIFKSPSMIVNVFCILVGFFFLRLHY